MWTRRELKDYAKNFLSKHYWKAFLVCLITSIVSNVGNGGGSQDFPNNLGMEGIRGVPIGPNNPVFNFFTDRLGVRSIFYVSIGTAVVLAILFIVILMTVGAVLEVGKSRFFLEGFKDDIRINYLFSGFSQGEYLSIVKAQFVRGLYTLLWSLLLIIPGIIKSYEYIMVPYILAEEPGLSPNEAITRSRHMTDGQKWDMFVLDLSFLAWYILALFFVGIGGIFVNPYKVATYTRLYNVLSDE